MDLQNQKKILIKNLIEEGFLKTPKIIKVFKTVPREEFVLKEYKNQAYVDYPLPILEGQTISAPHMVAMMTELLKPEKNDKVLEIGAGSGYQAAILSRLVKKVYTIELEPKLAKFAKENLERVGYKNVKVIVGDGSKGYPKEAPYDKIIITCAVPEIPEKLIEQLKEGGIILAPVGSGYYQDLILGIKKDKKLKTKNYGGCAFVPLRHY